MKLYNDSIKDLKAYKSIGGHEIPSDRIIEFLTGEHHKLCEEKITEDQFRENIKLRLG